MKKAVDDVGEGCKEGYGGVQDGENMSRRPEALTTLFNVITIVALLFWNVD